MNYTSEQWGTLISAIVAALVSVWNAFKINRVDKNSMVRHAKTVALLTGKIEPDPVTEKLPKP